MKHIIYARNDGTVVHKVPTPEEIAKLMSDGMTEDEAVEFIRYRDVPADATNVEIVEPDTLPDRTYRNAWRMA